jgi:coenzyme Q-binding protein COQ10
MAKHRESQVIPLPPERLFDVVADVESYPDFVPLMSEAKIVRRFENAYETEQTLALGGLIHRFRSRTELDRPRRIIVKSFDKSFSRFNIRWSFSPTREGHCRVDFSLDCEARQLLLKPIVELMVMPMATTMVSAFERRALELARHEQS